MSAKFHFLVVALLMSLAFMLSEARLRGPDGRRVNTIQNQPANPVPIELGGVEGKSYFVQFLVAMSWFEARDYCNNRSLKLATVETENQFNFLVYALIPHGGNMMWTAARESRQSGMFVWDGSDGLQPNASVLPVWGDQKYFLPYHHCGAFWANGNYSQFWTDTCEENWQVYALCQS